MTRMDIIFIGDIMLRELRLSKEISQSVLAERLGVKQAYISKLEHGQVDGLRLGKLVEMAHILEVTPCVLLRALLKCKEEREK